MDASETSLELRFNITFVSGWTKSIALKLAVNASPSVRVPITGVSENPGTSLSKLGTEMFCVVKVLKGTAVVSVLTEIDIVLVTVPSKIRSSTELKVTV